MIVEAIAQRLAERLGAAWFRVMALGMDEERSTAFKQSQGLDPALPVFGMSYPGLPLQSEYVGQAEFSKVVEARLHVACAAGFRHVFILNHHGGTGQVETLCRAAGAHQDFICRVEVMPTRAFDTFTPPDEASLSLRVGGHAGLAETLQYMAFYPESTDVSQLPEGSLAAAELGILHDQPVIPATFNPRRADPQLAQAWGCALLDEMERHIRQTVSRTEPAGTKS